MRGRCLRRSTQPRGNRAPLPKIKPKTVPCRAPSCPHRVDILPTTHCSRRTRRTQRGCRTGFASYRLSPLQSPEPSSSSSPSRRPHRCDRSRGTLKDHSTLIQLNISELAKHSSSACFPKAAHRCSRKHSFLPQRPQRQRCHCSLARWSHHVPNVCHGGFAAALGVFPRAILHSGRGED